MREVKEIGLSTGGDRSGCGSKLCTFCFGLFGSGERVLWFLLVSKVFGCF